MAETAVAGVIAQYGSADALVEAARSVHQRGYRKVEAYSPLPVPGLARALGSQHTGVPRATLIGGLLGAAAALFVQFYSDLVDYPINSGGRPFDSWPAFIPVGAIMAMFGGVLGAVGYMLAKNRLPKLYHPVFAAPHFDRATTDGFFLFIAAEDEHFHTARTRHLLWDLGALHVWELAP